MSKLLFWATDIHLNFLSPQGNKIFLGGILTKLKTGNVIVVTGDIAEAPSVGDFMESWKDVIEDQGSELYFVLGNHDFYRGSIEKVRNKLRTGALAKSWLPSAGIIKLSETTALIGHDGFYDGGYDNWFKSKVDMNDYYSIQELGPNQCPVRQMKFDKLQELSQEAADFIYATGTEALKTYDTLYVGTHVPPFREAAVHMGRESDPDWMPHFSSKKMGDALRRLALENPHRHITVLCGHTHGEGLCHPEGNLVCYTGKADYYHPRVANSFIVR